MTSSGHAHDHVNRNENLYNPGSVSFDDRFSVDLVCLYKFTFNYAEILFDCFNANFKTQV